MARRDLFKKDLLKSYLKERKAKESGNETAKKESVEDSKGTKKELVIENSIQIASDIHLEFANVLNKMPKIKVKAPILALLGDIGYPKSAEYQQFIKDCSSKFKHVILIAGNHEYYTDSIDNVHEQINKIASQYTNVHFLQCESLELPDIIPNHVILGCTLWVKFDEKHASKAMEQVNDYTWISTDDELKVALTTKDTDLMYDKHLDFIMKQCEKAKLEKKKVIVLSHHCPTDYKTIDPNYFNEISYLMNYTNIEHLLQPPVTAWFFGHTHYNMDIMVKCDMKQMKDSQSEETKTNNNDDNDDEEICYVRVSSNQQGYLHRGISDGYLLNKIIQFPILYDKDKDHDIEVIDYQRLVTLPFIKRLNQISST